MKDNNDIPQYALDLIVEEHKTETKKLWLALILVFSGFVMSNFIWIAYNNQYQNVITETQTVSQDGSENSFTGDFYGGDYHGETNSNKNGN